MIIIISSRDDVHVPFVTRHLREQYVMVDAGDIINKKGITYRLNETLTTKLAGTPVENVTSVWLRRPRNLTYDLKFNVPPGFERYSKSAVNNLFGQIYSLYPDALWVSDRYAIERASNKMHQLVVAKRIGFNIPETLMTSDPKEAEAFVARRGEVIAKSLSIYSPLPSEGTYLAFYAQKIKANSGIPYTGLHVGPCILQQSINPEYDIRVTVIGEKVFAATMTMKQDMPESSIRDWHVAEDVDDIEIKEYTLPTKIADLCVRLVKTMGLKFGAIDLIRDTQGVYWFIEINPNGQWAFVEQETGQPIGKALAELLESRPSD